MRTPPPCRRISTAGEPIGAGRATGWCRQTTLWTRRPAGGRDGVPIGSVLPPPVGLIEPSSLRHFPAGRLGQPSQLPGHGPADDAAAFLVLATHGDKPLDRLRAGEAMSAILLAATQLGLATTPLTQALEVDVTCKELQHQVLHIPEHPQLIIRIGLARHRSRRAATDSPTQPSLRCAGRPVGTGDYCPGGTTGSDVMSASG